MFKTRILDDLKKVVSEMGYQGVDIVCSIPKNPGFGDYTTNLALQLANQKEGKSKHSPEHFAKEISQKLKDVDYLEKVEVVNGFINFFISPSALLESLHSVCDYSFFVKPNIEIENDQRTKILIEYASFNALKPTHVGHMRNITIGESVSRLLESQGNKIFRVTYTSDIGLPAAKVVWAILQSPEQFKEAKNKSLREKAEFLGEIYVKGNSAFDESEAVREEIKAINTKIYQGDGQLTKIWKEALGWTFEYFQTIYDLMGTKFDKEILESEVAQKGAEIVRENIGKVFKKDQGAIIFAGVEHGLHNRVFISSEGNPTYEAKDIALAQVEYEAFPFDRAIHVVANDQDEYFKVVFKALEQINSDLAKKEEHLSYGYVMLPSGKMSSRKGNVVTLEEVYDQIKNKIADIVNTTSLRGESKTNDEAISNEVIASPASPDRNDDPVRPRMTLEEKKEVIRTISIGAMKFSILKFAPTTDITFDLEKSVSLSGDSGPYIQYSYARAKSVLRNAKYDYEVDLPHSEKHPKTVEGDLEKEERAILQKIEHFKSIVEEAADNLHPNIITQYLVELASVFNLFYQKHQIIKGEKVNFRLALTCSVAVILKQGLYLLGIESPERM